MVKSFFFTLLFSIPSFLFAQTFIETHSIVCGEQMQIGNLGYPTWNDPQITRLPRLGHAILLGDLVGANILHYTAPPCFFGQDTLVIACAKATQNTCDTGIYIFDVQCPEFAPLIIPTKIFCTDSA